MKSSLSLLLLLSCFCSLVGLLSLSLIKKDVFFLSTLQVHQIKRDSTVSAQNSCSVVLNWSQQTITASQAVQQIKQITGLKGEFIFSTDKVFFSLQDNKTILIENFTTKCQWLLLPVLVRMQSTTLLKYLINQIFSL